MFQEKIIDLLNKSHSAFNVVNNLKEELLNHGFIELDEKESFNLENNKNYFVIRNNSSLIAFKYKKLDKLAFNITASHTDSPSFKLKPQPVLIKNNLIQLNLEPYGGGIYYSFLDRLLSLAGRVIVSNNKEIKTYIVDLDDLSFTIPSLCIHMNRDVNNSCKLSPAKDLIPVIGIGDNFDFNEYLLNYLRQKGEIKAEDKNEVLSFDLYIYNKDKASLCGINKEFLSSPRLDDLSACYSSFLGFLRSSDFNRLPLFAAFDNEEVGSLTKQGANSTFLKEIIQRIVLASSCLKDYMKVAANSFMLSIDNGHANHPNYMEFADKTTKVNLGEGIVIKYNANQSYTSDSFSSSLVKKLCIDNNLKYQEYTNRSDLRGGSTLGNLSNSEISLTTVDIGLPQLAMHSSNELCSVSDLNDMVCLVEKFFSKKFDLVSDGIIFNED